MAPTTVTQNDYYVIWVKDVSGRTAKKQEYVRVKYNVTYQYYEIDDTASNTTLKSETEAVGCNTNVDLSKTGKRNYSNFIGWNTDPNATTKIESLKLGDPTTGQEDLILYGIFKYTDTISFSSSNTAKTYELNLTISKVTPFTTLQYSTDNKTWTNYTAALYITSNGTIYARTTYNGETIATNSITISNICENHVWSTATCTVESRCTICDKYNGPALGHDLGDDWYVTVAATCTTDGTERNDCTRYNACGEYDTRTVTKYGHSYGDYVTTTAATCTSTGVKTATCSRCANTQTQAIAKKDHSYGYSVVTAATCITQGTNRAKCSKCGYSYTYATATSSTNHEGDIVAKTVTGATCTVKGQTDYICYACGGVTQTQYTNALGHSWAYNNSYMQCTRCKVDYPG